MKTSKYFSLGLFFLFSLMVSTSFAQDDDKWTTVSIEVDGVCGMCKDRIEGALDVKGIKHAEWSNATKMCEIVYRKDVITEKEVNQLIADIGHDTKTVKATDEVYSKLHGCCKYRSDVTH